MRGRTPARAALFVLWWTALPGPGSAMTVEQMQALPGAAFLSVRVDDLMSRCGLPRAIADRGNASTERRSVRWGDATMALSDGDWDVVYSADVLIPARGEPGGGWNNASPAPPRCLADLREVTFLTQGGTGVLDVKGKAAGEGYRTTYIIPTSPYRAHQVIGLRARLNESFPVARLIRDYDTCDDKPAIGGGLRACRYWAVVYIGQMPADLYAVDFVTDATGGTVEGYAISTTGFEFVKQRLEALQQEWERFFLFD